MSGENEADGGDVVVNASDPANHAAPAIITAVGVQV